MTLNNLTIKNTKNANLNLRSDRIAFASKVKDLKDQIDRLDDYSYDL